MIVETTYGKIRGKELNGYQSFMGVPYAAPPVNKLRFRPPQVHAGWCGVRDCTHAANASPQNRSPLQPLAEDEGIDEDCLYLNVHTPTADGHKRAVVFFVHGGAYVRGSGSSGPPPEFYTNQNIVSVGVNYRLGILGFLQADRYLGPEYIQSGNCGFLDIVAALCWVRENIERFGGDPNRITVMGQSAGAKTIASLMLMPAANGLFARVILQSGATQCVRSLATAHAVADRVIRELGLEEGNGKKLLELPWQEFVRCQRSNMFAGFDSLHLFGPVFDDVSFYGDNALKIISRGEAADVDILCGGNLEEVALHHHTYGIDRLDEATAKGLFGNNAPVALALYHELVPDPGDLDAFIHMLSEYLYFNGTVQMVRAFSRSDKKKPIYLYRMDWGQAAPYFRAFHGIELAFVMGLYHFTPEIAEVPSYDPLREKMSAAWNSFIETGRPQAPGLPMWPAFDEQHPKMLVFDEACRVEDLPDSLMPDHVPHAIFSLDDPYSASKCIQI